MYRDIIHLLKSENQAIRLASEQANRLESEQAGKRAGWKAFRLDG
jgi:hypothetical protein